MKSWWWAHRTCLSSRAVSEEDGGECHPHCVSRKDGGMIYSECVCACNVGIVCVCTCGASKGGGD